MEKRTLPLVSPTHRKFAASWCLEAPEGWMVTFSPATRTLAQNAKLHAMLKEVSDQVIWYGVKLGPEDWKRIFAASLQGVRVVPGIDAGTFVPVGLRTRDMTVPEMSDMIELIHAFAAERGVVFRDQVEALEHCR